MYGVDWMIKATSFVYMAVIGICMCGVRENDIVMDFHISNVQRFKHRFLLKVYRP